MWGSAVAALPRLRFLRIRDCAVAQKALAGRGGPLQKRHRPS